MEYDLDMAIGLAKVQLVDTKIEEKKLLRNMEEAYFYQMPNYEKCILSELHKQGFEKNEGKLIMLQIP